MLLRSPHRGLSVKSYVALIWLFAALGQAGGEQVGAPTIEKIDPPNWFAAMPSPMLLIHGTGLSQATFTGAPVTRSMNSPNGHWAMLWLDTHAVRPGTLRLVAHTPSGETSFPYTISPRRTDLPSGFSAKDVMVCIMPDRFADGDPANNIPSQSPNSYDRGIAHAYHGGDLRGVTDHLDYLQELGITTVWLTPILANNPAGTDYHGYGATDMYAVDPHLGTLADYQNLGAELHRRHMKLVFDDVPNHVGPANIWAEDPPLPDWFHGTAAHHTEASFNFDPIVDPHSPLRDSTLALNGWFVNILPDMNQGNPVVVQYLTQNMIWWIEEAGVDGLRIDTFPYVQRSFWQAYLASLTALYPDLTSVGEVSGIDTTNNAFFAGGRAVTGPDGTFDTHLGTPFDYPWYWSLRDVLSGGRPFTQFESMLRQDWLYPHPERLVTFFGNHDQIRFLSLPNTTPALLRLAFGLTMTLRGTPQLYIGDEIGMTGGEDPENRHDFPGGFKGDPANAFTAAGRTPAQGTMHDWVVSLGKMRARYPALQGGAQQDVQVGSDTFVFVRTSSASPTAGPAVSACNGASGGQSLLVAVNRASYPVTVTIPREGSALDGCTALTQVLGDAVEHKEFTLVLPPTSFAAYTLR